MRILLFLFLLQFISCDFIVNQIGGKFTNNPPQINSLSPEAKKLIEDNLRDLNFECLHDFHVHVAGLGKNNTGIWVNPKTQDPMKFKDYLKFKVYMSAAGIKNKENADREYIERLIALTYYQKQLGKFHVLAFDRNYDEKGEPHDNLATLYVPNEYVFNIYEQNKDLFVPVISVHPYRKDALVELEKWAKKGAKFIKWLPNAMRIDPTSKKLNPYYEIVKKYDMTILTHTGEERAVDGEHFQKLANPLLLRKPLDLGIKIVMAHMASLGECEDLDNNNKKVSCFDLFWRMFTNKKYENNLFGEISGTTIHTRLGKPLIKLLEHPEYHHRIVNGSDYPLPAVNLIYRTGQMHDMGFITEKERVLLNEIYGQNPILFDLISKRILKHPKTGQKLKNSAFELPTELGCKKTSKMYTKN